MRRSKIAIILLSLITVVTIVIGLSVTASAVNYGFFEKDDIAPDSYAYSMAVIGDTQSLTYSDVQNAGVSGYQPRLTKIYDWLVENKDAKKIEMVIGLGDITETWDDVKKPEDFKAEWELAVSQISKLNGNIPYTLVRGNHDTESGFNSYIGGMKGYTDQFTGEDGAFMTEGSYGTSYRKFQISGTKWIIITLDWAPTGAELDWAADVISANPDHSVIVTMHDYLHNDMTVDGEGDSADTAKHNPDWDYSIDPTSPDNDPELVYNPDGIWERLISKHANIKLVLSGHRPNGNIVYSQLLGDNGNTVTQMLVDPQSMDLDVNNEGGCGMVCMLYFREDGSLADTSEWDGSTVDVEWYSTIKDQYHKDENQFTLDLDLYDGGVATEKYGVIPAKYLDEEKYPFVTFGYDDDIDEFFFHSAHSNWTTSEVNGAYLSVARFSAKDVPAYILLRRDFNAAEAGDTRYKNFGNMSVTLNLDLGGNTFTSSVYVFDANMKKASTSTINVYGDEGSEFLVGGSVPLFWLGTNQVAADGACFTYNFDGIKFGFADTANASSMLMATFSCAGDDAYSTTQNFNFSDCTFDLTNKPSKAVKLIQLDETVGSGYYVQKTNINVNGGSFVANGLSDITLYSANATDSVLFGEGVTFRLPSSYSVGDTVYADTNGISYGLAATENVNGETVYNLEPVDTGFVTTKYGVIPAEYSDAKAYPFAVFDQNGKFFAAYAKWENFLAAGSKILTSSNKKATLLVRRDYATSENGSSSQNWYTFSGSILMDLDGHTVTIDTKSHLFQFINKCSKDTTTELTIINGTIVTYKNYTPFIINGHTNSKADYTVDLTCNGVTFVYHKSSTIKKLLLDTYTSGTNESNFNAVFNDCVFDISQAPHAVTLFNAKESTGTVKAANITINGGVLKAPKFSYITFAALGTGDTMVFGQNSKGEYLTLQMPAGQTATTTTAYDGADGEKLYFTATEKSGEYVLSLPHVHKYDSVVTAPTCTTAGYTTYTCVCGDSYVDNHTAAIGHAYDNDFDADCNKCGEGREVPATEGALNTKITWKYEDGVLTINGKGKIKNFNANATPWAALVDYVDTVVIGEGITYVGASAFYGFTNVDTVVLPETLTAIGNYAFYGCSKLTTITIPANVTEIGAYAFRRSDLNNVTFAIGYGWSAGDNAFTLDEIVTGGATYLATGFYKTVWTRDVNATPETIDPNFVDGGVCGNNIKWTVTKLENGKLKLTVSGNGAMPTFSTGYTPWFGYAADIVEVEVTEGVTTIGRCAFYGLKFVRKATIADTVTAIDDYGFYMCFLLKSIELPEGVTVGKDAFVKTGVTL